jgi:predicted nucleic-acid-binding Zn-ribbon protein
MNLEEEIIVPIKCGYNEYYMAKIIKKPKELRDLEHKIVQNMKTRNNKF